MKYVLGVDPGKMTGYALIEVGAKRPILAAQAPWDDCWDIFKYFCDMYEGLAVAMERYTITMQTLKKARQLESLYVIGGMLVITHFWGGQMVLQSPGDAKGVMTDDMLKRLDWYKPGMDHANDALRHAGLYLLKTRKLDVPPA